MAYRTVYTEVEVEVDLADFDTDDLVEELESRGSLPIEGSTDSKAILNTIYEHRRMGKDYQSELTQLIWIGIGRIV